MGAAFYTVTITGAGSEAFPLGLVRAAGIALVYWFVYLRHETNTAADTEVHPHDAA